MSGDSIEFSHGTMLPFFSRSREGIWGFSLRWFPFEAFLTDNSDLLALPHPIAITCFGLCLYSFRDFCCVRLLWLPREWNPTQTSWSTKPSYVHIILKFSSGFEAGPPRGCSCFLFISRPQLLWLIGCILRHVLPMWLGVCSGEVSRQLFLAESCGEREPSLSSIRMQTQGGLLLTRGASCPFPGESLVSGKEGELTWSSPESCGLLCGWECGQPEP